jgi:hypothetical protein
LFATHLHKVSVFGRIILFTNRSSRLEISRTPLGRLNNTNRAAAAPWNINLEAPHTIESQSIRKPVNRFFDKWSSPEEAPVVASAASSSEREEVCRDL